MTANRILGIAGAILGLIALIMVIVSWGPTFPAKTQTADIRMGEMEVMEEVAGVEMHIGHFHRWLPAMVVAHKGDTVVLNVTNPDEHIHSLVLPAFAVDTGELAARGGTATVEFVANQAGTFIYACGTPFDEAAGKCASDHDQMVGYLVVIAR